MRPAPPERVRAVNDRDIRPDRAYVLYWMIAHRRLRSNFALQHAAALAMAHALPLVIFEPLRVDYAWASDRLHRFVIDGMAEHARFADRVGAVYVPFVERMRGDGRVLFAALCRNAVAVVTDDYPAFFLPRMVTRAGPMVDVKLEAVDSNGLLPTRSDAKVFATAYSFRAHVQRELRRHLAHWPADIPWADLPPAPNRLLSFDDLPAPTSREDLQSPERLIASLPIDHSVPATTMSGGGHAGAAVLGRFINDRLARYDTDSNHPDSEATSSLSPYLHFGHVSAHDVFSAVMTAEGWTTRQLGAGGGGKREGWWGVSTSGEAFLDQLITWRELGLHNCAAQPGAYDSIDTLPAWARATLATHATDPRTLTYTVEQLEQALTHDEVWNAAQRQMLQDGWMHNYLRMLWGKKILEWAKTPEIALETMVRLMDRHAIDGRDPNSSTGYLWTLGRYDRPWAPERPIFGTVRYMSSENTKRKLKIRQYLARYGPTPC